MNMENSAKVQTTIQLPPVLKLFAGWSLILTIITFASKVFCAFVLHLSGAYRQIVFEQSYLFIDFRVFRERFQQFHHAAFFAPNDGHSLTFMYPAPTALVYEFFYLLPRPLLFFLLFSLSGVLLAAIVGRNVLVRHGLAARATTLLVATALLCSYPLYVEFFLANLEIVVVFLIGAGICLFATGRSWGASVCFGIAGAMKLFPFIFFGLMLKQRQYRQIAAGIAIAVMLQVLSLWLLSSSITISWHGINEGLDYFRRFYILAENKPDIGIDHSLWGLYKGALILLDRPWPQLNTMVSQLRIYTFAIALLGLAVYIRLWRLPLLNHVMVLTIVGILFTPASKDYTLLHLYVPLAMLVLVAINASAAGQQVPGLKTMFICMTLLLAPLAEFVRNDLIFGAQIKAVVLAILLISALRYPLTSEIDVVSLRWGT